jgi:hypothetical protein
VICVGAGFRGHVEADVFDVVGLVSTDQALRESFYLLFWKNEAIVRHIKVVDILQNV